MFFSLVSCSFSLHKHRLLLRQSHKGLPQLSFRLTVLSSLLSISLSQKILEHQLPWIPISILLALRGSCALVWIWFILCLESAFKQKAMVTMGIILFVFHLWEITVFHCLWLNIRKLLFLYHLSKFIVFYFRRTSIISVSPSGQELEVPTNRTCNYLKPSAVLVTGKQHIPDLITCWKRQSHE